MVRGTGLEFRVTDGRHSGPKRGDRSISSGRSVHILDTQGAFICSACVVQCLRWFRLQGVPTSTQAADKQEPFRGTPVKVAEAALPCPESGSRQDDRQNTMQMAESPTSCPRRRGPCEDPLGSCDRLSWTLHAYTTECTKALDAATGLLLKPRCLRGHSRQKRLCHQ